MFTVDKYQLFIFLAWRQYASCKNSALKEVEIKDNIIETEWDHFWNSYIVHKTHNTT